MRDLANFITHLRQHGVTKKNRFRVTIPLPAKVNELLVENNTTSEATNWAKTGIRTVNVLRGGSAEASRGLQVMCISTQLPGTNITTTEAKHKGHTFKVSTGSEKTDIEFSFILSRDMEEYKALQLWREIIHSESTGKVGYYDDYTVDIQIEVLDEFDNAVHTLILHEGHPILFGVLDFDKTESDNFATCNVTYTYLRHSNDTDTGNVNPLQNTTAGNILSDIQEGNILGAVAQARDVIVRAKEGNLDSVLGRDIHNTIGNLVSGSSGLPQNEFTSVIAPFGADIATNISLSTNDKQVLGGMVSELINI